MVRCALLLALAGAAIAGCSQSKPPPEPEASAELAESVPQEERDFRGINWGDSKEMVAASEAKRSKVLDVGYRYATELGGYPAVVSYGYAGDRVAAAAYSFTWTGDTKYCTAGSQCSL